MLILRNDSHPFNDCNLRNAQCVKRNYFRSTRNALSSRFCRTPWTIHAKRDGHRTEPGRRRLAVDPAVELSLSSATCAGGVSTHGFIATGVNGCLTLHQQGDTLVSLAAYAMAMPESAMRGAVDYSSFQLQNKIAVVTGASQGIGRAIALGLAQAGAHLVLAKHPGPRMDEINDVKREIEALGRRALIVPTDVGVVAEVQALMDATVAEFGRIDILVNNAGWTGTGDALDVTEEEFDKTITASLKSVFFASQAAARIMLPQGGGRIIEIGSNFGVIAFKKRALYAAVKAAVHHLAKALSLEWAREGVLVNVVAPCITETESRKNILEKPGYKEWATNEMIPRGRWNQPEDLVGAVLFLASPFADMIVGQTILVDGGWTIH